MISEPATLLNRMHLCKQKIKQREKRYRLILNHNFFSGSNLVDMSDGKFEVVLIRQPKDLVELHECAVSLRKQNYDCNMITLLSAQNVKVKTEEKLNWSLDGEKAENVKEIDV